MLIVEMHRSSAGHIVVRPIGELDSFGVACFNQSVTGVAPEARLVIDLTGVGFIDSSGLHALENAIRRSQESGGEIALVCGRVGLAMVLHATGIDQIVTLAPTVAQAAACVHADRPQPSTPPIVLDQADDQPYG
jgi:anti-sigma B factor antagonist